MIGKVIAGNYRIIDEVGQDPTSTIYLARDTDRGVIVILKVIDPERVDSEMFLQRFERQGTLLQLLSAPQAVKVLGYGEEDGVVYVVFEYAQGQALSSLLVERGPLQVSEALDIAKQVALCLVDAHAKSVVHHDVRSANITLTAEGTVKVMNFGIAWSAALAESTAKGVLGSPHYLSPEQIRGEQADVRSDIYALGVTLFEMLSGSRPYDAEHAADVAQAHLQAPIPSLCQHDERIPHLVDELVCTCLAKEPQDRYPSASALLEAIDSALRATAQGKIDLAGVEVNLVGQTLGTYRIVEQIGRGGMAIVYKAYEPALDRYVAIKVLPQYFAHDPEFAARFEREAKSVAKLNHPNILPIYGYGQEARLSYIVMRYVEAGTLKEMLGQPLDLGAASGILRQIGQALDHAHQQGIVHRDVKPSNVLMAENKWALLTDFGLARMVESSSQLTKSGVGVGTPAYMSPEQGQGLPVDARSDVYALGVVLYEMVTGQVPYEAETPMAVVLKHITAPLPLPRSVNPALPERVERVILKAMAKDPDDRYQTAGETVKALERVVEETSAMEWLMAAEPLAEALPEAESIPVELSPSAYTAEPTSSPAQVASAAAPSRGRKGLPAWVWGVIGGLAVLIAVGAVWLVIQGGPPPATPGPTATALATFTSQAEATFTPRLDATSIPAPSTQPVARVKYVEPCKGTTSPRICIYDNETDQLVQEIEGPEVGEIGWWISWSPDGQRLVFDAGSDFEVTGEYDHKLYIVDADGSDLKQFTSGDTHDVIPSWSPDGEWIAFHRDCDLWIIHPDGTGAQMLLEAGESLCVLGTAWSPASQQIAFNSESDDGAMPPQVWVVGRDRSDPRSIYSFERAPEWLDVVWSPDGRQVACVYEEGGQEKGLLLNVDGSGAPQTIVEQDLPWSWYPSHWPPWGGEATRSSSVPDDPWGQVIVPPGSEIRVGLVADLSGNVSWLGSVQQRAAQMAIEDRGTIKGFPISAVVADGGCEEARSATAARTLVADPAIAGLVGHTCSHSCAAGAPVYEEARLVMISPSCTGTDLSAPGYRVFHRVAFRDDHGGDERNAQVGNTDAYQDFASRYQSRYNESLNDVEVGHTAAYAYDAMAVLLDAIDRVAVVDASGRLIIGRQALVNAVRSTSGYQGVTGTISFDGNGDRVVLSE